MQLPIFKDPNQNLMLMETRWKSILDPILAKPILGMVITQNLNISSGVNIINHRLGHTPQAWLLLDNTQNAVLYRSAAFDSLTITLTSTADTTISLGVF